MHIESFHDRAAVLKAVPELCTVWNAAMGPAWPLTERLLGQSLRDDPYFEPAGLFVSRGGNGIAGWVLAKTNAGGGQEIGRFAGRGGLGAWCVHPDHQNHGLGTALLEHAEHFLRAAGIAPNTLYFPHHLVPGVPVECLKARDLLEARGYAETGRHFDLHRDLSNWSMPPRAVAAMERNPTVQLRPARDAEREAVCDFVGREFPGPWTYTTRAHFTHGGRASDFVIAVEHGEIIGFCHTADARSLRLIPSTYWYPLLGEHFAGLGPIGIGHVQRKRGLGLALCASAVDELARGGATSMAIDWTTLVDFYAQLGFSVWKRYIQYDAPS